MRKIEIIVQSDYQDIYRIKDGVLLIINKFKQTEIPNDKYAQVRWPDRSNSRLYKKGCQKELKYLITEYTDDYHNWTLPVGSVLYNGRPIEKVGRQDWTYQIKTTGESFSGYKCDILYMLKKIEALMEERHIQQEDTEALEIVDYGHEGYRFQDVSD